MTIRLLTYTTLFPNCAQPGLGVFVAERLRHLLATNEVSLRVVAPVPWFPANLSWAGEYGKYATVPPVDQWDGGTVQHPKYPVVPKIGMRVAPHLLRLFTQRQVMALAAETDVIDAHYLYPDAVAAVQIARKIGKPVVVTARGSDVNLIAQIPGPDKQVLRAARDADAVITVSDALKVALIKLGVPDDRITVLRNGVDLDRFHPTPVDTARKALADVPFSTNFTLAMVGNLLPVKGHELAIRAIGGLPGTDLLIAGDGPLRPHLEALIDTLRLGERIRFVGRLPQSRLALLYSACDALLLTSEREGLPNVVLEAQACGTPVVASDVGGVAEVVSTDGGHRLITERTPDAVALEIRELMASYPDRTAIRASAGQFDWAATTRGQMEIFRSVTSERHNVDQ